mgnify:CR=1 FL=1
MNMNFQIQYNINKKYIEFSPGGGTMDIIHSQFTHLNWIYPPPPSWANEEQVPLPDPAELFQIVICSGGGNNPFFPLSSIRYWSLSILPVRLGLRWTRTGPGADPHPAPRDPALQYKQKPVIHPVRYHFYSIECTVQCILSKKSRYVIQRYRDFGTG